MILSLLHCMREVILSHPPSLQHNVQQSYNRAEQWCVQRVVTATAPVRYIALLLITATVKLNLPHPHHPPTQTQRDAYNIQLQQYDIDVFNSLENIVEM